MSNNKYTLKRVDNIHGTIKATFVINNLTSEDFVEQLDRQELEKRVEVTSLDKERKALYLEALDAVKNFELNLLRVA